MSKTLSTIRTVITELNKKTLAGYIDKAASSAMMHAAVHHAMRVHQASTLTPNQLAQTPNDSSAKRTANKRLAGVRLAAKKLAKEEATPKIKKSAVENAKQNIDGLRTKNIDNIAAEEVVNETINHKALIRQYRKNEDENFHDKNAILMAKHFGTPEEHALAKKGTNRDHMMKMHGYFVKHLWPHDPSNPRRLKEDTIRLNKINEVLSPNASASTYIDDFVHSKNKMFKGDSKKQRIRRALGAYFSKHKK